MISQFHEQIQIVQEKLPEVFIRVPIWDCYGANHKDTGKEQGMDCAGKNYFLTTEGIIDSETSGIRVLQHRAVVLHLQ